MLTLEIAEIADSRDQEALINQTSREEVRTFLTCFMFTTLRRYFHAYYWFQLLWSVDD